MPNEAALKAVFEMQDLAAIQNEVRSSLVQLQLAFVSDAFDLAVEALNATNFRAEKHHALRVLGTDILSSLATSARISTWGNCPESIAVLRCALETCAILAATVEAQDYDTVTAEIQAGRSNQYTYAESFLKLADVGARMRGLHGRLSNIGSHANARRFRLASYQLDGKFYDRVGAALDPSLAELGLNFAPDVCLHLLESIEKAYLQDSRAFPNPDRLLRLRDRFLDLKSHNPKV